MTEMDRLYKALQELTEEDLINVAGGGAVDVSDSVVESVASGVSIAAAAVLWTSA
ncbi:hypothetical protein [Syntrophomonas palmitatica]|uniref:hypothetical protein n=1 Tax=Syntrophomonas palmitatica TaxID=402877 RepID=UPI000B2605DE|nr:hypothetical protein [Syntrophomonas palmitatica]